MSRSLAIGLLALGLLAPPACLSSGAGSVSADIVGVWGGDGVQATLTATGGTIEFECASASIEEPLVPGPNGRFRATGRLFVAAGGPAIFPVPEGREPRPLKYRGRVDGKRMRLAILRPKPRWPGEKRRSVYQLEKGRPAHLEKCR